MLNRTHTGMSGRLQVPISVTYDADPRMVEAILIEIAEQHPLVLEDPAPRVLFLALGADTMDFELRCWLRDVNFSLSARSDLNFEIIERFRPRASAPASTAASLPAVPGRRRRARAGTQPHLKAPSSRRRRAAGARTASR